MNPKLLMSRKYKTHKMSLLQPWPLTTTVENLVTGGLQKMGIVTCAGVVIGVATDSAIEIELM